MNPSLPVEPDVSGVPGAAGPEVADAPGPAGPEVAGVPGRVGPDHAAAPASDGPSRRRHLGRRTRRFVKVAALVIGLVAGYYLFTVGQVWWEGRSDHARGADAIVVLGAAQYDGRPSPQLASRLDHALDLYRRGTAPLVVLTGGKRPGDRFTEAQAGERYLEDRGVPASAIAREDSGTTSFESIQHAATLLKGRGLRRVVLVSDPFHSLRIRLSAEEVGLVAVTSPTRTSPVGGRLAVEKHFKEAVGVAIGRIIGFSRLPT